MTIATLIQCAFIVTICLNIYWLCRMTRLRDEQAEQAQRDQDAILADIRAKVAERMAKRAP